MTKVVKFTDLGITGKHPSYGNPAMGAAPQESMQEIAAKSENWNTESSILKFIERASLCSFKIDDYRFDIIISDAPYSDWHFMPMITHPKVFANEDWTKASLIHEYPKIIQSVYWYINLKLLKEMGSVSDEEKVVVLAENTCVQVTNFDARLPRSLRPIHAHLYMLEVKNILPIEPSALEINGLSSERTWWKNNGHRFLDELHSHLNGGNFTMREVVYPAGYEMELQIDNLDLDTGIKIADILEDHHAAYEVVVNNYLHEFQEINATTKPQPSYRTYIVFKDGILKIIISPILVAHSGGLDAVGIMQERSLDAPSQFSRDMSQRRNQQLGFVNKIGIEVIQDLKEAGIDSTDIDLHEH
jgi:hypothetical protein